MAVAFLWSVDLGARNARFASSVASLGVNAAGDSAALFPLNLVFPADVSVEFALGLLPREYEPNLPIHALVRLHSPEADTELEFTLALAARAAGDALALSFGDAVSFGRTALPATPGTFQDLAASLSPGDEHDNAAAGDSIVARLTLLGESRSGTNSAWVTNVRLWQEIPG